MATPCEKEEILATIRENIAGIKVSVDRLNTIEKKLDKVLRSHWTLMGGISVISAIIGIGIQLISRAYR